ncbi:13483_t:CDS:2 [Racocetra fulgida]|uniref:13483_t:CDS:1 n=1 Tax=Racocetra fulgida TaxID=60492 RepID=A0A9N8WKW9_9GLOM|nr:13483_t:CDS:2 [Racocetra fulgida]
MSEEFPQEKNVLENDESSKVTESYTKLDVGDSESYDVPSIKDLSTLRKVAGRIPTEKNGQPGAIGAGQQTATALTLFFQFFCYITPIFGAILADQYIGRFNTIFMFCCIYMVGLVVLTVTAIPQAIAAGVTLPGLIIAMVIIGLGTGGIKCNVAPLAGEQNTLTKPYVKVLANGDKVVVDPELTTQSIFHWFYLAINIGALSPVITTNVEKYHSYWLAYLIPLIMFIFAILVLIIGKNQLVKKTPNGSALLNCFRVLRVAYSHDRSLENAKPSNMSDDAKAKERVTWDDDFVDQDQYNTTVCNIYAK